MSVATLQQVEERSSGIDAGPAIGIEPQADSASEIVKGSAIDQVRDWLLDYRPTLKEDHPEIADIGLDLDLIENRVIDSLGFMNFVFFLEELTGRELIAEAQSANSFRTLRIIDREILQGGEMRV